MSRASALRKMYMKLKGDDAFESRTSAKVSVNDDDYENPYIECIKDGHVCWTLSASDVLFDYIALTDFNEE